MKRFIINSKQVKINAIEAVKAIMGDDNMEVLIRKHKSDKTAEQRNSFHMLCKMLGDEVGYTGAEMKEVIKKQVLGTKTVKIGYESIEITESSESLNRSDYSQLIDSTYRIASELGVILPDLRN